ncbi:aminoglycoside phosphotransferase family protein [Kribbella sp. NPDC004536]|uniref:aminoglycoside phosphotransferase family protein n=1 Tax=Kribbella sp. NPDC004536 TaxID=3364106 RepID=UPI0036AE6199
MEVRAQVAEQIFTLEMPEGFWFPDVEPVLRALREQFGVEAVVRTCVSEDPVTYLTEPREWFDDELRWIGQHVQATGPFVQVKSWGLSNVLRIPTAGGDVYFKALPQPSADPDALPFLFAPEPRFLRLASADRPGQVPAPIAIDEERAWMLLADLGTPLEASGDVGLWIDAVRNHARLQRSYVSEPERLLSYSCSDRRLAVLDAELDRLLEPNRLTRRLDPMQLAKLPDRAKQLREAINELAAIGVPETLLHGDLHPRNLAVRDGNVLAFDWTDVALAHPFLDLVTFVEKQSPLSADSRVRDAYLAEWEEYATPADLRRALILAEEVGTLYQAITYLHLVDHLTGPSQNSMLRGGSFWMDRLSTVQDG